MRKMALARFRFRFRSPTLRALPSLRLFFSLCSSPFPLPDGNVDFPLRARCAIARLAFVCTGDFYVWQAFHLTLTLAQIFLYRDARSFSGFAGEKGARRGVSIECAALEGCLRVVVASNRRNYPELFERNDGRQGSRLGTKALVGRCLAATNLG